jgi:hypothetical protein
MQCKVRIEVLPWKRISTWRQGGAKLLAKDWYNMQVEMFALN